MVQVHLLRVLVRIQIACNRQTFVLKKRMNVKISIFFKIFYDKKRKQTGVCGVTASKQLTQTDPASTARANVKAQSIFLVKIPEAKP